MFFVLVLTLHLFCLTLLSFGYYLHDISDSTSSLSAYVCYEI